MYLDDSVSMRTGSLLFEGGKALDATLPLLARTGPLRVVKFGGHKTIVAPRENAVATRTGGAAALLLTIRAVRKLMLL